jgi:two-component system sensor histidine kinase UhpB
MGDVTDIRERRGPATLVSRTSYEGGEGTAVSLFWRIFSLNAAGLVVATALLLGPVTVSTPVRRGEAVVVLGGLALLLVANALVLRVGLVPLQRLGRAMAAADLLRPGVRAPVSGPAETAALITTYNTMLDRLEAERATGAAHALSAQERERHRIARELHDEVGQTLTAVLLQLKRVADRAPEELREDVGQAQEATRAGLDEIRRIARRLRPGVLEELGLPSALRSLAAEFTTHGLTVRHHVGGELPRLTEESELVVYRVAQEGLTNTARHSPTAPKSGSSRSRGASSSSYGTTARGWAGRPKGPGSRGCGSGRCWSGPRSRWRPVPGGGRTCGCAYRSRRRRADDGADPGAARRRPHARTAGGAADPGGGTRSHGGGRGGGRRGGGRAGTRA